MRQIVYISQALPDFRVEDLGALLYDARYLNRKDGVTGLLLFDGKRFLQALEGSSSEVGATFARISKDKRHQSIAILSDRTIEFREFGNWDMATKVREASDYSNSVTELVAQVSTPEIKAAFAGFVGAG